MADHLSSTAAYKDFIYICGIENQCPSLLFNNVNYYVSLIFTYMCIKMYVWLHLKDCHISVIFIQSPLLTLGCRWLTAVEHPAITEC